MNIKKKLKIDVSSILQSSFASVHQEVNSKMQKITTNFYLLKICKCSSNLYSSVKRVR